MSPLTLVIPTIGEGGPGYATKVNQALADIDAFVDNLAAMAVANTFTADQTFTAKLQSPGAGANSVKLGNVAAASVSGSNAIGIGTTGVVSANNAIGIGTTTNVTGASAIGIGTSAVASSASNVAIGSTSTASGALAVAVGPDAVASGASTPVAVGRFAQATGTQTVAVGGTAIAAASSSVAIGNGASVVNTMTGGVAIGQGAAITLTSFADSAIAIGHQATAKEGRAVAVGPSARAWAISSTAIGRGAIALGSHDVAVGRGSWTDGSGPMVAIGKAGDSNSTMDVFFNSGHTHKYDDPIGLVTITRTPSTLPIVIHGFDAFDATATPTSDVAGGSLTIAAGRGTGTAVGGAVKLQVAPAGAVSNNTKNTLVTVVEAGVSGTARTLGFFGAAPVVKPTGVAVDAAGIHAALVSLGLIAA